MDSQDRNPDSIPEDLTFNDIESITEFFAEVVFNWSNAFEEHDEQDVVDGGALDFHKFYFANFCAVINNNRFLLSEAPIFNIAISSDILSPYRDVSYPPPKL